MSVPREQVAPPVAAGPEPGMASRTPVVVPLDVAADPVLCGGKATALQRLRAAGLPAPDGLVVTTRAYHAFAESTGLRERVALEFARRPLRELRLEETWDVSLRIRAWFLSTAWPARLLDEIDEGLGPLVTSGGLLVVRSSAPHEDGPHASYAGLHESAVGVSGRDAALDAVRSVWASLFSDRALLYHAEVGLDPSTSAMAVLVQPLVHAERAGVAFTRTPGDPSTSTIEAVWGLGEGLVSGRVEPDTWTVSRAGGLVVQHRVAHRERTVAMGPRGPEERALDDARAADPPLSDAEVRTVWELAMSAEALAGSPQDCEWAIEGAAGPLLTQARPITARTDDERSAYLGGNAGFETLQALRIEVEERLLPGIAAQAADFAAVELSRLKDDELADESARRADALEAARERYRTAMIPFAHAARAFGRIYTDAVHPVDAFEYVTLLARTADEYVTHERLLEQLGVPSTGPRGGEDRERLERGFLGSFSDDERPGAAAWLDLARASWRLRDDDNLYVALLEREAARALAEVESRLMLVGGGGPADGPTAGAAHADTPLRAAAHRLRELDSSSLDSNRPQNAVAPGGMRPRQLLGQPAGPGLGAGPARVIRSPDDLRRIEPGDVVVADAFEPDTAAYAARAAGIVERRGGMLVHGAILAREHKIACVTGVVDATALIRDGEAVTVDGYLGIVVLSDV